MAATPRYVVGRNRNAATGLTLSSSTGIIADNPTAAGSYSFTVATADVSGTTSPASATQTVTVTQKPTENGNYTSTAQAGSTYSSAAPALIGAPAPRPAHLLRHVETLPAGHSPDLDGGHLRRSDHRRTITISIKSVDASGISSASNTLTTFAFSAATASAMLTYATKRMAATWSTDR
jgi:hypothetical protein